MKADLQPRRSDYCYLFGENIWDESNPDGHQFKLKCFVKIGSTGNPTQRLAQLRTLQPLWDFRMVWFAQGCGLSLERELQSYYSPTNVGGELFILHGWEVAWLTNKTAGFFGNETGEWEKLKTVDWREKWVISTKIHAITVER